MKLTSCYCFAPDGDLYTGTVADFSGMDPIIYREPLQTEQYNSMSLNGKYQQLTPLNTSLNAAKCSSQLRISSAQWARVISFTSSLGRLPWNT